MCARREDGVSASVARVIWTNNVVVNSALDENSRESSSSALSTKASFDYDRNKETLHNKIKFVTNNSK